jgi:DNA-binding CsgD family transcriptional regulator
MKRYLHPLDRKSTLTSLIVFQGVCVTIFMWDVWTNYDLAAQGVLPFWHLGPEILAVMGLIFGITFKARYLFRLRRQHAIMERGLSVAAGALASIISDYFNSWALTPAEQDVANFTIKGFSITEIAQMRNSAEATIKTHLNSIYRKAGVTGRGQLVSLLIEDLLHAPIVTGSEGGGETQVAARTAKV